MTCCTSLLAVSGPSKRFGRKGTGPSCSVWPGADRAFEKLIVEQPKNRCIVSCSNAVYCSTFYFQIGMMVTMNHSNMWVGSGLSASRKRISSTADRRRNPSRHFYKADDMVAVIGRSAQVGLQLHSFSHKMSLRPGSAFK